MKKNNENKIILIACILTVGLVGGFTLSQGTIKFKVKDDYQSEAATKEDIVKEDVDPYSIVRTLEDEGSFTIKAYQNKELTDDEIINLIKDVKKENSEIKDNYKINIYSDESSVDSDDDKNIELVVKAVSENKISINKRYSDIESESVEVPEYTSISAKNVYDEENNNATLKTKIEIILEGVQNPKEALSKIKAVGNYTRVIRSTYDILNIIGYTSNEMNEYWEYSGHSKNDIVYGRVINLK